jgi:hypothetical protein
VEDFQGGLILMDEFPKWKVEDFQGGLIVMGDLPR